MVFLAQPDDSDRVVTLDFALARIDLERRSAASAGLNRKLLEEADGHLIRAHMGVHVVYTFLVVHLL